MDEGGLPREYRSIESAVLLTDPVDSRVLAWFFRPAFFIRAITAAVATDKIR